MPEPILKETRRGDVTIAYELRGHGLTTVVLVMGLGSRAAGWGEIVPEALAREHRVIAIDNRGTGRSSRPAGPYSIEEMALDAIAVLDAEAVERAHVVGVSMGGMISQIIAYEHRARVDRLVLLSTSCGGGRVILPLPRVAQALMRWSGEARAIVRNRYASIAAPGWAEQNAATLDHMVDMALEQPVSPRVFFAQLGAVMASDRYRRLRDIDAETLVVHGDADPLVPYENGQILARQIAGARLETMRGVGHLAMWEAPDALASLLTTFLAA